MANKDKVAEPVEPSEKEFTCKFCGAISTIDPVDQVMPPDYCQESDHE